MQNCINDVRYYYQYYGIIIFNITDNFENLLTMEKELNSCDGRANESSYHPIIQSRDARDLKSITVTIDHVSNTDIPSADKPSYKNASEDQRTYFMELTSDPHVSVNHPTNTDNLHKESNYGSIAYSVQEGNYMLLLISDQLVIYVFCMCPIFIIAII